MASNQTQKIICVAIKQVHGAFSVAELNKVHKIVQIIGCGICTTRCKFDAIHLRKRTNVESVPYETPVSVLPNYINNRKQKIQIRKSKEADLIKNARN